MEYTDKDIYKKVLYGESKTQKQLADELNISLGALEHRLKNRGITTGKFKNRISRNKVAFNNPAFCYFLGLYQTDGWVNSKKRHFNIQLKDKEVIHNLANRLEVSAKDYRNGSVANLYISKSYEIERILSFYSSLESKTTRSKFIKIEDNVCQKMYVRGIFDGDGSYRKGCVRFGNASAHLVYGLRNWLNCQGVSSNIRKSFTKSSKAFYTLETRRASKDFLLDLNTFDFTDLSIPRKINMI